MTVHQTADGALLARYGNTTGTGHETPWVWITVAVLVVILTVAAIVRWRNHRG